MKKTRQSLKIREIGDALASEGFITLDEQARALGLCRSTTWTLLKANHKSSGLSASVINRMLASPRLPALARSRILEYVEDKMAGLYGHSQAQLRRFTARLSIDVDTDVAVGYETGNTRARLNIPPVTNWPFE